MKQLNIQYAQALLFCKNVFDADFCIFLDSLKVLTFFVASSGCAIHWPMTKDLVTTWKGIQRSHFTRLPFLIRIYRRKISKLIYVTTHACLMGSKIYTQKFSRFETILFDIFFLWFKWSGSFSMKFINIVTEHIVTLTLKYNYLTWTQLTLIISILLSIISQKKYFVHICVGEIIWIP